jgi:hypothetical protein
MIPESTLRTVATASRLEQFRCWDKFRGSTGTNFERLAEAESFPEFFDVGSDQLCPSRFASGPRFHKNG